MKPMSVAIVALALTATGMAGCNRNGEIASHSSNICTPFPSGGATGGPVVITDPAAAFDDCLHRWSYSLAASKDGADLVAAAAVSACGTSLSHWNQQSLSQGAPGQPDQADQTATSLTTGQSGDIIGQRAQYAQSRALFYVVQARAGGCAAPAGKPAAGEP